jgi:hypothetical protein
MWGIIDIDVIDIDIGIDIDIICQRILIFDTVINLKCKSSPSLLGCLIKKKSFFIEFGYSYSYSYASEGTTTSTW